MSRKRNLVFLGVLFLVAAVLAVLSSPGRDSVSAAGAVSIEAGSYHTCALTSDGGLRCWGENGGGALGDGTTVGRPTPVDVLGLASGVSEVSAGGFFTCALTEAGGVKCWGENMWGAVGDGTDHNYRAVPVDVTGLASGWVSIAAGSDHACAAAASGGVKCWGHNNRGQLGDGTTTDRNTPVDVLGLDGQVIQVAAGASRTCALKVDGGVECWGSGWGGASPVAGLESGIAAISVEDGVCALTTAGGVKCGTPAVLVPGLESGVVDVSGDCAVMSDGRVRCAGADIVGLDDEAVAVSKGWIHICALMSSGAIKCWGDGRFGQLGNGTLGLGTSSTTPVDVLDVKPGWCPPGGCPEPPPGPVPLPDCADVAPELGEPGMTLTGPATVLAGDRFTVCVNADPEPTFDVRGIQAEVEFPEGTDWVQRPNCASISGDGEAQVTVDGAPPGICLRGMGPEGQAWLLVDSGGVSGPPLDVPLGRLFELDAVCAEPGSYTLVLVAGGAFGASYWNMNLQPVVASTIEYLGRDDVADIHTVTCIAPEDARDSDGDGCTDVQELLSGPEQGGYRDPNNFWDFFDVPTGANLERDGAVSGRDFFAVLRRFNTEGDPGIDPLSTPPETGYHPAYDRGAAVGPNAWNVGEADGSTSGTDFFASVAQFNHECN